jgi:Na+/H+ antiporter NhaD/arsenite permease-like protein
MGVLAAAMEGGAAGVVSGISPAWATPFVVMLAAIALMPFVNKHWWERWYPAVAIALGAVASWPYLFGGAPVGRWVEGMTDYVSFIVLLGALFVVSGGIVIKVQRKATPLMNCTLLLMGAVVANVLGTTGASMLLIRPYLRMNRRHLRPYHVVFFIFIVSNVGGSLTPVGDPPLFLGYLMGVPFWWVLEHMRGPWAVAVGALLVIFFVIDTLDHRKEERHHEHDGGPAVQILGIQNVLLVLAIVGAVFKQGLFEVVEQMRHGEVHGLAAAWGLVSSREVIMVAAAALSRAVTGRGVYEANEFSFGPIREVAILFVGIFATMVPATQYMQANADRMPLKEPGHFYFASGVLSSVLDNAPTYKTLLETRLGEVDPGMLAEARGWLDRMGAERTREIPAGVPEGHVKQALRAMVEYHPDEVAAGKVRDEELEVAFLLGVPAWNWFVVAISAGSVFWGACTYIGNGPNFMVKSIADAAGVRTPGFAAYVWKYTLPVLIPLYLVIWLIFFRS